MTRTLEERQHTARVNGSKSRGPTSTTGKLVSRRNSLKLGIYAKVVTLPDEDPELVADLRADWYKDIQPRSRAAEHLLEDCIYADMMSMRTRRAHQTAIANQGEAALRDWDNTRFAQGRERLSRLASDTQIATAEVRSTSQGCLLLMDRFTALDATLASRGFLTWPECEDLCLLAGFPAAGGTEREVRFRYLYQLWNAGCQPPNLVRPDQIATELRPENRPPVLRTSPVETFYPGNAPGCRDALREAVAHQIVHLQEEVERLRSEFENDQVARVLEPQAVLHDPQAVHQFLRYQADCRTTFHRSYSALLKTVERDKEALAEGNDPEEVDDCAGGPGDDSATVHPPGKMGASEVEAEPRNGSPTEGPEGPGNGGAEGVNIATRNEPTLAPGRVVEAIEIKAVTERTSDTEYEPEPPRREVPDPGTCAGRVASAPPPPQLSLWDLVVRHAEARAGASRRGPEAHPPEPG
jgi:hypothetical protein